MKKNNAIMLLRIISMFMIVLCHVIHYYTFIPGSVFLGQFFNVGVQVFLLISGYLYGNKEIDSFGVFYKGRIMRVSLPVALLAAIVMLIKSVKGEYIGVVTAIAYLLNLQGLPFIQHDLFSAWFHDIDVLDPLRFCTVIMICYAMIPLLQYLRKMLAERNLLVIKLAFFIIILSTWGIFTLSKVNVMYFLEFTCGYFIGTRSTEVESVSNSKALFWIFAGGYAVN